MSRRPEMLIGWVAFVALGAAFAWSGLQRFSPGPLGTPPGTSDYAWGGLLVALGAGAIIAAVLVLRARWTPPPPGDPVEPAPDRP